MKKAMLLFLLVVLSVLIGAAGAAAETAAEPADAEADWTVMFYLCGSDLESQYGFATGNLKELMNCKAPASYLADLIEEEDPSFDRSTIEQQGRVNVLIETGGCAQWRSEDLGIEIAADSLQRWRFEPLRPKQGLSEDEIQSLTLEETLPLQSMSDPGTLSDFIRWSAERYPAKKYALVLWDHGGGAKSGLFVDELFNGDILYLYELNDALANGGTQFECVIIDACLMANLETACAVKDYARWMVASEELVAGRGSAIFNWMQALYNNPQCDGLQLGRCVCDMSQAKYANLSGEQDKQTLTWSVIDLSKIDRVAKAFDWFFKDVGEAYKKYHSLTKVYAFLLRYAEEYAGGREGMRDLAGPFYHPESAMVMDARMRSEMLDALNEAVAYCVRGSGRSGALGLSFCYAAGFDAGDLDVYARNCPSPHYLALLDAITGWTAPDRVYENAERLPEIDTISEYELLVEKTMVDGMPCLCVDSISNNRGSVNYCLYRLDGETGQVLRLGRTPCKSFGLLGENAKVLLRANDPMHWPTIGGEPCDLELISEQEYQNLYSIPVRIGRDLWYLRCGRTFTSSSNLRYFAADADYSSEYEIYGLWEGYDEDSQLPNRNVKSLAQMVGQDFRLVWPVKDAPDGECQTSEPMTFARALDIGEVALPEGTYYLQYEVNDMFVRPYYLDLIELHWDGEQITFPEDFTWEGTVTLSMVK